MSLLPPRTAGKSIAAAILEITKRDPRITLRILLYRLVQLVGFPFILLYFAGRLIGSKTYRPRFFERFGRLHQAFKPTDAPSIWLHAVSVGEVASAAPLVRHLREEHPDAPLYISVSTVAGRRAAAQQLGSAIDGIFYAPFDYAHWVRRVLRRIRPALVVVLETEIWPNLYYETKRTGAAVAIVNARISNRTWPRYRQLGWFFGPILQLADAVFVQSGTDAERYRELGVEADRLRAAGNLKYDAAAPPAASLDLDTFGAEKIWIAASTVGPDERGSHRKSDIDEDDLVIAAFQRLSVEFPKLLLILAPRQPARFDEVARKLSTAGVRFVRRSEEKSRSLGTLHLPGVLLLDSIGELSKVYELAQVAFVGGSLAPRGGHNILEPAAAAMPVIVGPHMENFEAITRDFIHAGALIQLQNADELPATVGRLLGEPELAKRMGERARNVVAANRGSVQVIAPKLWQLYCDGAPRKPQSVIRELLLSLLAKLWVAGGRWKRKRDEAWAGSCESLSVPVISIGGITVGGSGKTPLTGYLARQLRLQGRRPAILTRGYRRRSTADHIVLPAGTLVPPRYTGDEARIFLRTGAASVGIGVRRYETARLTLSQLPETDIFLLDDGFQHARLRRDVDIVVIDGLDPWGGEEAVPLGRLREPLDALKRANMFMVTRAEDDLRYSDIRARLNALAPGVPVFRSRSIPRGWHDAFTGAFLLDLRGVRAGAFCGLGNPRNFWDTLAGMGTQLTFRYSFRDHHRYRVTELLRLAQLAKSEGANWLLTTEKDRNNFPEGAERVMRDVRVAWLEIDVEVEDEARFLQTLNSGIAGK